MVAHLPIPRQIAELILADIVQTNRQVGSVLPSEARMAAQYGVSRSTLREALKQLEGRGYIEVINGRGAVVKPLDTSQLDAYFVHAIALQHVSFRELMEARKPIEVQSARLAAQRRTPDQLDELNDIIADMRRNVSNADVYVDLDHSLHALIAEASGNIVIAHVIRSLRGALNELTHTILYRRRNRQQLERVHLLHESIVAEIGYQNGEAAAAAMNVHFSEALAFLIARQEGARR